MLPRGLFAALLLGATAVNALPSLPRRLGGLLNNRGGATVTAQGSELDDETGSHMADHDPSAMPPAAEFKSYWDKAPPLYDSVQRHPRYSTQDWLNNLLALPQSQMLARIFAHLVANTIGAAVIVVAYYHSAAFARGCAGMSPTPHSLAAGALSLLMVFRTNSAYDRFWEGRKLWGKLTNMTHELARLGHTFLRGLDREHFLALVAAFPPLLMQHLQGRENTVRPSGGLFSEKQRDALQGMLGDGDMELLWKSRNRPFTLTKMLGAIIASVYTDPAKMKTRFGDIEFDGDSEAQLKANLIQSQLIAERAHIETMIAEYANVYGACERITKSAVPQSYSSHTSRMLTVWCGTLPFALVHSLRWRTVPAIAVICWMLFTIEEVGHSIEDPFNLHVLDQSWAGREDELRIEASLNGLRGDVMERMPATDPMVAQRDAFTDPLTTHSYDPVQFHEEWIRSAQ